MTGDLLSCFNIIYMKVLYKISRLPGIVAMAIIAVVIMVVGAVDLVTGYRLAFSVFYLIPVFLASYYLGLSAGVVTAILSAATWLLADFAARGGYPSYAIPVWNFFIRLGVFLFLTVALYNMRVAQRRQDELMNFLVHDLRTPLAIILNGLILIRGKADERQAEIIDLLTISCNRMGTLINSILDLSRLENRKMTVHIREESTRGLLEKVVKEVSVWARHNKVEVGLVIDTDLAQFRTDGELLHRILINLLSNAVKWSPEGAKVILRVFARDNAKLVFSVRDRGPGISREMTKKIFDKFTQLEHKEEGILPGSGLGLNFCKLAVERLGGRIWINSEKGKGTEVVFELPLS